MNKTIVAAYAVVLIFSGILSGCAGLGEPSSEDNAKNDQYFYQHWVNSYEEQTTGGHTLFRPQGSREFPTSRFRMEYVFNTNGTCQYKYLSPIDAHKMEKCVFTKVGNKIYIYNNAGRVVPELSFTLMSPATKDSMMIAKGVQKVQVDKTQTQNSPSEKGTKGK